jgi:DNA-binding transcriptional ArsR family regulator
MTAAALADLECVTLGGRAATLLQHPLRSRILELARSPASPADIAARLGESRQKVNYHVRQLERARFLDRVDQRRKRNMVEQRYVATARAYVLAPQLLGPIAPRAADVEDALSATHLLALASQTQSDLVRVVHDATAQGKRVATMSMSADFAFVSAQQRADFTRALHAAIADVIARHTTAIDGGGAGAPLTGRPFRLVLGVYPIPAASAAVGSATATSPTIDQTTPPAPPPTTSDEGTP